MKCFNIGSIQAYLDDELGLDKAKEIEEHILKCNKCSNTLKEMQSTNQFVGCKVDKYKKYMLNNVAPKRKQFVYSYEEENNNFNKKRGVLFMKRYQKVAMILCGVMVGASCLMFQPVRAAISELLMIFRADNMKTINFTLQDLRQIQESIESNQGEIDLYKMGKISMSGGQEKRFKSFDEIANVDFGILNPSDIEYKDFNISLIEKGKADFTLNVDSVNEILERFGSKDLLPKSIDEETFSVNFSPIVSYHYNLDDDKYIQVVQTKSPEIIVPSDVNVDEIYNSIVSLPVLPETMQRQLKSIKDWKSTLYIPSIEGDTEEISINGSKGYVMTDDNPLYDYSSVFWLRDGVIYSVSGDLDKEQIINIAKSMR